MATDKAVLRRYRSTRLTAAGGGARCQFGNDLLPRLGLSDNGSYPNRTGNPYKSSDIISAGTLNNGIDLGQNLGGYVQRPEAYRIAPSFVRQMMDSMAQHKLLGTGINAARVALVGGYSLRKQISAKPGGHG